MPARKKRRSFQHVMEEQSLQIIREVLPEEWAIHDYKPDYGIDMVVEIFEYSNSDRSIAETLGELFFVQVKSIRETKIKKITSFPRMNIEKRKLLYDKKESREIEVIKFEIETNELMTIQSMGNGVPVLLFLVSLDLKKVFFVCLNNLIDKVIVPDDLKWLEKDSKTIYIPTRNEVLNNPEKLVPLHFYAKRIKWYSAFMKFSYQESVLIGQLNKFPEIYEILFFEDDEHEGFEQGSLTQDSVDSLVNLVLHFIERLKSLDIWDSTVKWPALEERKRELMSLEHEFKKINGNKLKALHESRVTWLNLGNLSCVYEEICREWYLPTYFSALYE